LLRNAVITRPNQAWPIDITYIPIKNGFLYLTAVIDWYSRCIVGWEVDDTLDTRMVIASLKKAFKVAKPLILNSDQGCQFTSVEYMEYLRINGVRQSMDRKSRWGDNIMIERWFHSFKFERAHSSIHHHTPAEMYYPALLIDYVVA
jgi:putative transposase